MASRTFRVLIRNRSSKLVLSNTFTHLCEGGWTGGWEPAGVICFANPGSQPTIFKCPNTTGDGALQSESDWAFAGTEGYIKYDVFDPTLGLGTRIGMVYVYWNNPFYGTTHCRFAADSSDVAPDCDYSGPGAGSVVPPGHQGQTLPFTFVPSWGVVNAPDHGMYPVIGTADADPQAADFAAGLAAFGVGAGYGVGVGGLVAGVGDLAATTGVIDHAWIQIDLIDGAPKNVGSLAGQSASNPTRSLDKQPARDEWVGQWNGSGVTVNISSDAAPPGRVVHVPSLTVVVQDATAQPPIAFTVPVDTTAQVVRPARGAMTQQGESTLDHPTGSRLQPGAPAHAGASVGMNTILPARAGASARMRTILPPPHADTSVSMNTVVRLRGFDIARDANGVAYVDGVMYLPQGIALRLFKQYQGGTLSGYQLGYQRIGIDGRMATNQLLARRIKIA